MKRFVSFIILCLASASLCFGQTAHVNGRNVIGSAPKPVVSSKASGIVIVQVRIDEYGNVVEAAPGVNGTTTTDSDLWAAAKNAALKTHFNVDADAPFRQVGTITYKFGAAAKESSDSGSPEKPISIKQLVDECAYGVFTIKGFYKETYSESDIVFLLEDEQYIIPIQLLKKDLGAADRFRALGLHRGDSLIVKGVLDELRVDYNHYKGLSDAVILDIKRTAQTDSEPLFEDNQGETTFKLVEQKPTFRGGDANEFSKWVNSQLRYPDIAKENGVQGRVTVSFTVKTDGSVDNVRVLKGVDSSLDAEAVRVISSSPKWKPGRAKGEPVDVTLTFPVFFSLK